MSLSTSADQERYLAEMLDPNDDQHQRLLRDFSAKVRIEDDLGTVTSDGVKVYRKKDLNDEDDYVKPKGNNKQVSGSCIGF